MTLITDGSARAHFAAEHEWRVLTFRVTLQVEPERAIMKLEGKMVGPWVNECRHAWNTLLSSLEMRKLALDLCSVTFVDECGLELLREIHRATGADMITGSPLTKHFADQVTKTTARRKKGE